MFRQHVASREEIGLLEGVAGRDKDARLGYVIADGDDGLEKRLIDIVSEAAYLPSGSHIHSEERICLLEA